MKDLEKIIFGIMTGKTESVNEAAEPAKTSSPFDWKNKPSELPTKKGEKAGFDSKKISTGTVYSRKPTKEEVEQANEAMMPTAKRIFKKAIDKLTHGSDEDMVKDLQKKVGVPQTGKVPTKEAVETKLDEKLVGKQKNIDMNNNGEIDGQDFEIIRGKKGMKKEEVEQVDELSKSTLGSYVKMASDDAIVNSKLGSYFANKAKHVKSDSAKDSNTRLADRFNSVSSKRRAGISKAVDRLTKEEVELTEAAKPNEIHVSDAGGGKYKVHAVGSDFAHGVNVGEHLTDTHLDDFSEMGGKIKMVKAKPMKEEFDIDPVNQTIIYHDSFEVALKESYEFNDYLSVAKQLTEEEDAVQLANEAFNNKDVEMFLIHSIMESDVGQHILQQNQDGLTVSLPKYTIEEGIPCVEYVVTEEDGLRCKHIHLGIINTQQP